MTLLVLAYGTGCVVGGLLGGLALEIWRPATRDNGHWRNCALLWHDTAESWREASDRWMNNWVVEADEVRRLRRIIDDNQINCWHGNDGKQESPVTRNPK